MADKEDLQYQMSKSILLLQWLSQSERHNIYELDYPS